LEKIIEIIGGCLDSKKELTFCFYKLGIEYLKNKEINSQHISDACAAMRDSEAEFRRKILNPYLDKQIEKNGDII
jgi:hypothetical protein